MDFYTFLKNLDLTDEGARILQVLLEQGEMSVFELGKKTGIIRTTVYRALDTLTAMGLVIDVPNEYRKTVRAAQFEAIKNLVDEKKAQLNSLLDTLPSLQSHMQTSLDNKKDTKVYFYKGTSGIKQLQWNILTKGKECRALFSEHYVDIIDLVGKKFEIKWMENFKTRQFAYRGITTPQYHPKMSKKDHELAKLYDLLLQIKTVPPTLLKITHEMRVYGNTVAFYNLDAKDITGIEIINKNLALMFAQMFDMYWGLAS